MSGVLPKGRLKPTRLNPKILVLYGVPKVGKTTALSELDDCMVLDGEGGAEALEVMRIRIKGMAAFKGDTTFHEDGTIESTTLESLYNYFVAYAQEEKKKNPTAKVKPPYRRLAMDTIDKMEDFCILSATAKFKLTPIGKGMVEKGLLTNSVLEIPQGGGYYYLRREVVEWIEKIASLCEELILISHVKEKNLDKGGIQVSTNDISLTGKLAEIVCSMADAIGYMYRGGPGGKELWVSFETDGKTTMGARFERLKGRRFKFDWNEIYLPADATGTAEAGAAQESIQA